MPTPDLPIGKSSKLSIRYLTFDRKNPRYSEDREVAVDSDRDVIEFLLSRADLKELIDSIAHSGYIDIEPLIVTRTKDLYTVLEGNRRFAAIRLLREPDLAESCKVQTPPLADGVAETLDELTVYAVNDRADAQDFIGFKHINGPHRWDSIAKARYAATWYHRERNIEGGMSLQEIARRMGDRHDTLKRMVLGINVLDQAKASRIFQVEDRYPERPFAFSHLYTALTRKEYRNFLGLPDEWRDVDPEPNPIPQDKIENLKKIMLWLYGSADDDVRPVVTSQNPHIKWLAKVIEKPKALAILNANSDLKIAYGEVNTAAVQFEHALIDAQQKAQSTLSKINAYNGNDHALLEVAVELEGTSNIILRNMEVARKSFVEQAGNDAGSEE